MKSLPTILAVSALLPLPAFTQVQATRAFDVYDSVGVNTHWYFGNGYQYQPQFSTLASLMAQNHIMHFRDGVYSVGTNTPQYLTQMYATLAGQGIHADLIVPQSTSVSAADLEAGLKLYPGLESIEPPNEWDISGGWDWVYALLAEEPAIYKAGHDMGVTVLGPALTQTGSYGLLGNLSQDMDLNNLHIYFSGRNPENGGWGGPDWAGNYYGSIPFDLNYAQVDGPGRQSVATETGYVTTQGTPQHGQIPEWVAAIYAPRLVLDFFKMGIKRTYFYELVDDPSYAQPGYGLLRYDLSPKPAFTAISNLLSILEDGNAAFTPATLNYTLSGDTSGVETMLVQKSAGQFWLAVWLDGSIYDVNALRPTPIASRPISLSIQDGKVATYMASFGSDGNTQGSSPNQSNLQLNVSSGLTMIRIASPGQ